MTDLVTRYREGATVYELAERFRIHRATVSEHLHRRRVRMRGLSLEQRQVDEAIRLYEQGWSVAKIERKVDVDGSTVWRALRKEGLRMRDTQGRER